MSQSSIFSQLSQNSNTSLYPVLKTDYQLWKKFQPLSEHSSDFTFTDAPVM